MNLYKRWVLHIDATDKIISDQYRIPIVIIYPLLFFANNSFNALSKHLRLKRSSLINVKFRIPKIKTKAWKKGNMFHIKNFQFILLLFCLQHRSQRYHRNLYQSKIWKILSFFLYFQQFSCSRNAQFTFVEELQLKIIEILDIVF